MIIKGIVDCDVLEHCCAKVAFLIRSEWNRKLLRNNTDKAVCLEVMIRANQVIKTRPESPVGEAAGKMLLLTLRHEAMQEYSGQLYGTMEEWMDYCGWVNGCRPEEHALFK